MLFMAWPCSSVVEQYPEKVCVVSAILTKTTTNAKHGVWKPVILSNYVDFINYKLILNFI